MQTGDHVRIADDGTSVEGIVLPSTTDEHIVVKRSGGYNVGFKRANADVEVLEPAAAPVTETGDEELETSAVEFDPDLPTIALVSTGGTIASTVDYRTGAVSPQFDMEDILRVIPELGGVANYRCRVVARMLSENMTPQIWQDLAEAIVEEIENGADGVVVMHGTDTMQYTASAIAFMVDAPVPIVFTGSQRSADRPSSDNVMNAVCAVEAAKANIAEVLVCMHAGTSDDTCAIHRATRVRKNHTSRRDAFETVGSPPLATMEYSSRTLDLRPNVTVAHRSDDPVTALTTIRPDVELVKFVVGASANALSTADPPAGVVIEGTGLGHVNESWVEPIRQLTDADVPVVMTSQCLEGRVCDRVYETGRDLIDAGVIEAGDTLPETAVVKLMWALEHADDVADTMRSSLVGELTAHSRPW